MLTLLALIVLALRVVRQLFLLSRLRGRILLRAPLRHGLCVLPEQATREGQVAWNRCQIYVRGLRTTGGRA